MTRHGGHLVAEFPDDGGTRFVLRIPLGAEGAAEPSQEEDRPATT
ncbi:MAG: hypothetical protein NVSMB65_07090 [Chloroflexota bacterium]